MKFFVVICLLVSATVSFAADRAIYDLQYLPKGGTLFGFSEGSLFKGNFKNDSEGVDLQADITGWQLKQQLGYSITDNLSIGAEFSFLHQDYHFDYSFKGFGSASDGFSVKGLADPVLNAKFRALEAEFILDFKAAYFIPTGDRETDGSENNNKNGGPKATVGAELGKKINNMQFAVGADYTKVFKATTKDKDSGDEYKDDAHNEYLFHASGLFGLSDTTFLKGIGAVNFLDQYDDNQDSDTAAQTKYILTGEFNQVITANLMARAGLEFTDWHQNGVDQIHIFRFYGALNYQF